MSYLQIIKSLRRTFTSLIFLAAVQFEGHAASNLLVRVVAANLTSGSGQSYEAPGIRIFQGLKPDVVAIQEFQYAGSTASNDLRTLVNTAFGTNFSFYCEPNNGIPNGIVSRLPIHSAGFWDDSDVGISDRGFAWARIDLPGTNDLYVVSVHLKAGNNNGPPSDASRRAAEAAELKDLITTNFPSGAWIIVAGDLNLYNETEGAITTFRTFLSDAPVPADQNGDTDTNSGRSERYDRVLASFSLTNKLVPVVMPSRSFANGLVFDSRVYSPLSDVSPVLTGDSGVSGMQHMAVVKDFKIALPDTLTVPPPLLVMASANLLYWQGVSNVTYSVQSKTNLADSYWVTVGTVNSAGTNYFFTNASFAATQRLFRVAYP